MSGYKEFLGGSIVFDVIWAKFVEGFSSNEIYIFASVLKMVWLPLIPGGDDPSWLKSCERR